MRATLIKKYGVYMLLQSDIIIASSDENFNGDFYLSKQNCDEIFRIVDVNRLGSKHYEVHIKRGHTQEDALQRKIDFIIGFNQAMELNKDKLFSKADMFYIMNMMSIFNLSFEDAIIKFKSLQQQKEIKEIAVEIEVEKISKHKGRKSTFECKQLKLDENGCLILKPI
jgi:hypothetical protein